MDVLHGFLEKRDDVDDGNGHKISFPTMCDQLNFTFGANVIPGLYVGLGPSGAIGWGNGAKASYNVGVFFAKLNIVPIVIAHCKVASYKIL